MTDPAERTEHGLDRCTCGNVRHQHEDGVGKCFTCALCGRFELHLSATPEERARWDATEADLPRLIAISAIEKRLIDTMLARRAFEKAEPDFGESSKVDEYYCELTDMLHRMRPDLDALAALRAKPAIDAAAAEAIANERKL